MPASLKTQNFDFPLYQPQDLFAPLTDFNLLSNGVDRNLMLVKTAADSAEAMSSANELDIQEIETKVAGIQLSILPLLNLVNLTFNPGLGMSETFYRGIKQGDLFLFEMRVDCRNPSLAQKTPLSETVSIITLATSPNLLTLSPTNPAEAWVMGIANINYIKDNENITGPSSLLTWRDENIQYYGIPLPIAGDILAGNVYFQSWGTAFRNFNG